ncbi:MAG TPA: protein translocase subunit SecD [Thermoanaerobaculia bacterium]|nr:protein translocase subunit SecD [Thermoanaerobaculia bacterium]
MNRTLRWKLAVVLAVVIGTSFFAWFPPLADHTGLRVPTFLAEKSLRLGVDLRGGVQFVLRVNADEALTRAGADEGLTRDDIVAQAKEAIDRRINALGVVEPVIAVQGERRDEILVQLPGFTDVDRARAIVGATARLEWRLVENGSLTTAAVTGSDIRRARLTRDDFGRPAVGFTLTPDGARRFAEVTSGNIGRQLAIVLDGEVQSAPFIESAITGGEGIISGGFTMEEALDLRLLLQAGALPASMSFLGGGYVGPTLGASAVDAGVAASVGGLLLLAAFMLVWYRGAGVNAIVALAANLAILLGAMAYLGAALTLPGIAGLILTIGMGVDSNVLIFERIKEELRAGQSVRRAVAAGFDRVLLTILDTHVTSLIAAAFLFQFGGGAIRGFATTLSLGLLSNMFTSVVVSRALFEVAIVRGSRPGFGSERPGLLAARGPIDVMKYRKLALVASAFIIAAGLTLTTVRGLPLGLDFTGGTAIVTQFEVPVPEEDVRRAMPGTALVQRYGPASDRTIQIRLPLPPGASDGDDGASVRRVEAALRTASVPDSRTLGSTTVGPTMGKDLQRKGAYAMAGALSGITAYVAVRFRPSFALGAALATVHDLVVTIAMLSLAGYDLDLNVVAGLLAVAGYSVNDTIVIFDRVRERLRTLGRGWIGDSINVALTDMLGRTLITSGTTLLAVLALYLFGGTALGGFAFTVLVGVIVGTWSTVFVAAPIAAALGGGRRRG